MRAPFLKVMLAALLVLTAFCRAQANSAIVFTSSDGAVFDIVGAHTFAQIQDAFIANPVNYTLQIFGHAMTVDSLAGSGANVTSLTFHAPELGINQTFTGTDTASSSDALRLFMKSEAFLRPLMILLNSSGPGATNSGTPYGTVDSVANTALTNILTPPVQTAEEKNSGGQLNSINIGVGLSRFDTQGFSGTDYKVSPAYTWKVGAAKVNDLNLTVPLEDIDIEGVHNFRGGMILQLVHPFALPGGIVWKVGPDLSYSYLVSLAFGAMTGTIGGGLTSVFHKDWEPYFGDLGLFYGRFQNLGGLDTGLQANSYSYGLQVGRRISQRWVLTGYGIGVRDDVVAQSGKSYGLAGGSIAYRIYKSFNLQLSVNRTFGLPGFSDTTTNLGSAWNF